jgi:hypothetical protein
VARSASLEHGQSQVYFNSTVALAGWDGGVVDVIWSDRKLEYFSRRGWTAQIRLHLFDKIASSRTNFLQPFEAAMMGQRMRLPNLAPRLKSGCRQCS